MKKLKFLILLSVLTFAVSCGQQKRYVSYKVKEGETMRDIAKRYNLKTKDLLRLNPDVGRRPDANTAIIVPNLKNKENQIGKNVSIKNENSDDVKNPKHNKVTENEKANKELENLKKNFIVHKVKPKETIYSLKRFYNVSEDDLFALNPNLKSNGLKAGEIIKIKPIETDEDTKENLVFEDNIKPGASIKLALLLPFRANEYTNDSPDDIFERNTLANMVTDFYMGAEIAIDSIKKQGVNVDVHVFDTGKRGAKTSTILSNGLLNDVDAIIGPFYSDKAKLVANKVKAPVIFPHFSDKQTEFSSSKLVATAPNKDTYQETLINYLSKNYNKENIVIVGDGNSNSNASITRFVKYLKKQDSITTTIHVLKPENGYIKKERFTDIMKPNSHNWLIIISDDTVIVANALNSMVSLPENATVKVFTPEKSEAYDKIDNNMLASIGLTYVSSEYTDENTYSTKAFNRKYKAKNNALPSSYATKGFDVTYDVLARLVSSDNDLKETFNKGFSYRLANKFDYDKSLFGTTKNNGVFIVKYNKDLSLVRLK
ncbi:LysM peptidoglycan-binding domain-containing protein [Tenacibaculum sp. UWU-22]|uniref:LysM peptidoglycan-binding domain-containing protein n=1 Tax=Tenacibaculum sp. UWU-22 TaxID=3234187 RepID=UPI0034DB7517